MFILVFCLIAIASSNSCRQFLLSSKRLPSLFEENAIKNKFYIFLLNPKYNFSNTLKIYIFNNFIIRWPMTPVDGLQPTTMLEGLCL